MAYAICKVKNISFLSAIFENIPHWVMYSVLWDSLFKSKIDDKEELECVEVIKSSIYSRWNWIHSYWSPPFQNTSYLSPPWSSCVYYRTRSILESIACTAQQKFIQPEILISQFQKNTFKSGKSPKAPDIYSFFYYWKLQQEQAK